MGAGVGSDLSPNGRPLAAARRGYAIGARRQADGFVELAGERGLVRVTTFERQFPQGRTGVPEPVAGSADPKPRQILAGGEAKQSSKPLMKLERRKAGARREFRNTQGLIEMILDIGERG